MARPLRIDVADGWYHVTARGIERRSIFGEDVEYAHFLELLEESVDRYRLILHAFVQLRNHYHLVVQTPEANLSSAMQWLNVSYAVWFNRRNQRVGPLFQGRFKSIPVENSAWAYELSLYVHLNPVLVKAHGLSKHEKKVESLGWVTPDAETVTKRLKELRRYPWSSYRAYAGYVKRPAWLRTGEILRRATRRTADRVERYRADVCNRLSRGVDPLLREQLADGFALGAERFREQVRRLGREDREVAGSRELRRRASFESLMELIASLSGESPRQVLTRRGNWSRPLLMWAARRYAGMTLREVGDAVGGRDYTAVAMAVKRFEERATRDPSLRAYMRVVQQAVSEM